MPLDLLILTIASMIIGVIASMLGIGGGALVVPLLVLVLGADAQTAIGTSLLVVLLTAISSTIAYIRERLVDYQVALILSLGTIPGGILGAYITKHLSSSWLLIIFALFLFIVSGRMLTGRRKKHYLPDKSNPRKFDRRLIDAKGRIFEYRVSLTPGIIASFAAGFVSGLLGIGGGTVMVPAMVLVVGMPMHLSVSASMFIICLTSLSGVAVHWTLGHISLSYALILSFGTIIGAQLGARLASKLKPSILRVLFALALIPISLRMILLGIFEHI